MANPDHTITPEQRKECRGKCRKLLPATAFYFHRNRSNPDGFDPRCKVCRGLKYRNRLPPGAQPSFYVERGVTLEQFEAMMLAQGGVCAICREPPQMRRLDVDHEHETGRVRGLLCRRCNTAIGKMRDDPKILLRAIAYLKHYRAE
jgi:hypothetical protein